MEEMLVPTWLEALLSTQFFSVCSSHRDSPRPECNMFCLDCKSDAFCFYCRSSKHHDHPVIQIRRSSYHDVIRVAEVQKILDVRGVQTYVINSARVLFLKARPQPKTSNGSSGKGVSHLCEICGRSLLDTHRFCSLGCKFAGLPKNGDANIINLNNVNEDILKARRLPSTEEEALREGNQQDMKKSASTPNNSQKPNSNSRKRKGTPRRAPLGLDSYNFSSYFL